MKKTKSEEMQLHADLQCVDKPDNISLNICYLLKDTDVSNDTSGVVPRSYKLMMQIRGTNITTVYCKNAKAIADKFRAFLKFKKGEAVIYDHRLLHYLSATNSNKNRVAAILVMVPNGQQAIHYFAKNERDGNFFKYIIITPEDLIKAGFQKKTRYLPVAEVVENYHFNPLTAGFDALYVE